MSTNYDLHAVACENACEHCDQYRTWHIGKTGGRFVILQGFIEESGPGNKTIKSWRDWIDVLAFEVKKGGTIKDEYGNVLPLAQFIVMINSYDKEARMHQMNWIADNTPTIYQDNDREWSDAEGYSFSASDFSQEIKWTAMQTTF